MGAEIFFRRIENEQLFSFQRRNPVDLLGELHRGKAEARLRLTPKDYALRLEITEAQYFKRLQVYRTLMQYPKVKEMWEKGEITFSHIVAMGPRLTPANVDMMLASIVGKTSKEARSVVSQPLYAKFPRWSNK